MSRAFLAQPSGSSCTISDAKCIVSLGGVNSGTSHGASGSSNLQLKSSSSQAFACKKISKRVDGGRKVSTQIVVAAAGNNRPNSKNPPSSKEKTTSQRLKVVRNATPGLLVPLSIVGSDLEDIDEAVNIGESYSEANLLTQLLIQKKKAVVQKKKKAVERAVEDGGVGEGEIAANSQSLGEFSPKTEDRNSAISYESTLMDLIDQLQGIRLHALALERWHAPQLKRIHKKYYASARNLLHYVAFRSLDIAELQESLASSGLSSLEGCEAHTMASVNSISSILRSLLHAPQVDIANFGEKHHHSNSNGQKKPSSGTQIPSDRARVNYRSGNASETSFSDEWNNATPPQVETWQTMIAEDISFQDGNSALCNNAELLLGPSPPGRKTQVMVTLPSEAAEDDDLIPNLFHSGMNVARVNCAHDGPEVWKKMADKVRYYSQLLETPCRIMMDLAGPKLRTGPIQPGPSVIKIKPSKDSIGDVISPACVWLSEEGIRPSGERIPDVCIPIVGKPRWAKKLQPGDVMKFKDVRGRARELHVVGKGSGASKGGIWCECSNGSYIQSGTELVAIPARYGDKKVKITVGELPEVEEAIVLRSGDKLILKREAVLGKPAQLDKTGKVITPAMVTCTLEQVFDTAKPGESVKFDDGKISGIITSVSPSEICVKITEAGDHKGRKLRSEKAINFPESSLSIRGLTLKDAKDLDFVVENADILALSFVNGPADVHTLQEELAKRGAEELGIVMKIETELGFQTLPSILLQAMETKNPVGVMVARGDMAVECGWQRLAEIQDQILLICEASHVPAIWATQVLEGLAKSGLPSRAEITDAASGSRAECVMLNKGPHILQAVASLDDILRRESCHRRKNQSVLHPLQHLQNFAM